jgi:hydrogenase/urease accessory protein HupE
MTIRDMHTWAVRISLALLGLGALIRPAVAHPVPFSYLDVRVGPASLEASLVVHIVDAAHDLGLDPADRLLDPAVAAAQAAALQRLLAPRVTLRLDGREIRPSWSGPEILPDRQSLRFRITYPVQRTPGVLALDAAVFPYDPDHRTFLNLYEGGELASQAILDRGRQQFEHFSGTRQGIAAVVRKFVPAGIHHILIGPDHLLFLVGLLLTGGSVRRLLIVVSAFTVAHSVTLSLAALNLLVPPAYVIEPAIALSIVYVGIDNLLVRGGRDMRGWIALAFGFIHGFGFANVLRDMELPARALGWSLFSFNVGVEVGQIAVVALVAAALAAVRSKSEVASRHLAWVGSIAVIAAGTYWFVQRTFFPEGIS